MAVRQSISKSVQRLARIAGACRAKMQSRAWRGMLAFVLFLLWRNLPHTSVMGPPLGRTDCYFPERLSGLRSVDGLQFARDDPLYSELARMDGCFEVFVWHRDINSGFWATTHRARDYSLRSWHPSFAALTAEEVEQVRDAYADMLLDLDRDDEWAAGVRANLGYVEEIVWSGYVNNAITLLVFTAFLASFKWRDILHPRSLAMRRLSRNCCPSCNYSQAGLDSRICPECGFNIIEFASQ